MTTTWETLDWDVLDRLRATFLSGDKTQGPYWHTITDLECYDFTYGERIGWKWDAVLAELSRLKWSPPEKATILDWGCGSGIAGRRVVAKFGAASCARLVLHDHSALALDYAEHRARQTFPELPVERADVRFLRGDEPIDVLVISHVVNELHEIARAELAELCARAQTILWVEPGTHEVSRALGRWREELRERFQVVAPCTHRAQCGMFAPGNERHWCHFFAAPPLGIHADSQWVKFGQRAGIDLRSLPYAYLALDRRAAPLPPGWSRIVGEPRLYKGYAKIFNSDVTGVQELTLQKRDAALLFKAFKRGDAPRLHRWTHENGRITHIESESAEPSPDQDDDATPAL